jgi:hypothetical protein
MHLKAEHAAWVILQIKVQKWHTCRMPPSYHMKRLQWQSLDSDVPPTWVSWRSKSKFCIHVNTTHKDIRPTTTLNYLFMNMPCGFQVLLRHHMHESPENKLNLWGLIPSHCICWKSSIDILSFPHPSHIL